MKEYSPHWREIFFAAVALHVLIIAAWKIFSPNFFPEPLPPVVQEISFVEVNLPEEISTDEEIFQPVETPTTPEILPEIPPLPEPVYIEEPKTPEKIERVEEPEKISQPEKISAPEKNLEQKNPVPAQEDRDKLLVQPPVTVKEFYPAEGSGLGYKGQVYVMATIGKDGKVRETKIIMSSGRILVDGLAQDYAKKWEFRPALDAEGKPMVCDKVIVIDFKKI